MQQEDILKGLNSQQREAVLDRDGAILIIAGAGAGKTRVLTTRIALLLQDGIYPSDILALTFTKKAAEEMRTRIALLAGPAAQGLVMGTFHSVFIRFLRQYYSYTGFPQNFTIYDEDDANSCLKEVIGETLFGANWNNKEYIKSLSDKEQKDRKKTLKIYETKEVKRRISALKNEYILPKDYNNDAMLVAHDSHAGRPKLGQIYETYMKRCRKAGAMDFDDILVYTLYLLTAFPSAAQEIARRFRYILVDEYQDTNKVQYEIVKIIAGAWNNICAVGDDSQSIYAFRGARIQNILNFKNDFIGYRLHKLETNYRSTSEIVNAANRLISNNEGRIPKVCLANRGSGTPIETQFLRNDREEARYIVKRIEQAHREGAAYSDNAILYRTNAQARALEDELIKAHIPYVVYSGMSFFERMEVKDTVAYMRLCVNNMDNEAFKRICNKPARGISDVTLQTLLAYSSLHDQSLWETAVDAATLCPELKPKAQQSVKEFVDLIKSLTQKVAEEDAYEGAKAIIERTGIYALYKNDEDDDGQKRAHNIDELMNSISYYLQEQDEQYQKGTGDGAPKNDMSSYLENIALLSRAEEDKRDNAQSVSLMTSHASKGLEFETVFIAGVEEDLYPALRSEATDFDLEEERRLFYVSVTRAKTNLILTSCEQRWRYREMKDCRPSRFLGEMFISKDLQEMEDLPE